MTTEEIPQWKVSWSSLQRFEECPMWDHLTLTGHANPAQNIRNFLRGRVLDQVMRKWLDDPQGNMVDNVEEQMVITLKEAKEDQKGVIRWKSKEDRQEMVALCKEAAVKLQPILEYRVLPYDYEPAKTFKAPALVRNLEGQLIEVILRGEFDLLVKPDSFHVWDLKMTLNNDYWQKCVGQLQFYDLAIYALFNEFPDKCGIIQPMCDEQIKEFHFDKDSRMQLWSRILTYMEAQFKDEHPPKKDNNGCSICPVHHACSKFKKTSLGLSK